MLIADRNLNRVPCRAGMCKTPIHVTSSQLIASEIIPPTVVKALLYPGAAVDGLLKNKSVPSWDDIFEIYNLTDVKQASAVTDLQRLEVRITLFLDLFLYSFLFSKLSVFLFQLDEKP